MIKEIKAYQCDKCKEAWSQKSAAETHQCKAEPKKCLTCGREIPGKSYYTTCAVCREIARQRYEEKLYNDARKMTWDEYEKEFPGYPACYEERCFFDEDAAIDSLKYHGVKDRTWVWGTSRSVIGFDAEVLCVQLQESDEAYEDYEVSEEAGAFIQKFVDEFNEKYGEFSYSEDTSIVVLLRQEAEE